MKKISQAMMILLGVMFFQFEIVWAQTGSLKIDVDIPTTTSVKEQTFFEQDVTLKQLFDVSLSQTILKQQTEGSLSNSQDKARLFLSTIPQTLYTSNTSDFFLNHNVTVQVKGVTLREQHNHFSFVTLGLIGLGVLVSSVSLSQFMKKRKSYHVK